MQYIHEQDNWPTFTWDDNKLLPFVADVRYHQGKLLGRMEGLGFPFRSEANLNTLTADVVKSSAIEGEFLPLEQVRSSIARRLGIEFAGMVHSSHDVDGIVEMMLDATQRRTEPLTAERLFGWHALLFPHGRSGMYKIKVGAWRTDDAGPMQVISGGFGREKIHFVAPSAERVEREMLAFLLWVESEQKLDPLMKAGIAHLWFLTIHPFEDGNGRIARAIVDMLLGRADGCAHRYYSMSSQIELDRKEYYLQLERCQRGSMDITQWLEWFLRCLERALAKSEISLMEILRKAKIWEMANAAKVNQRQQLVINRLLDGFQGNLTTSKYAKLAKCSEDTGLRDIRMLIEAGILIQNSGGGRSSSYSIR